MGKHRNDPVPFKQCWVAILGLGSVLKIVCRDADLKLAGHKLQLPCLLGSTMASFCAACGRRTVTIFNPPSSLGFNLLEYYCTWQGNVHGDGTCAWLTIWYCKHEEYWLVCVFFYKQYCVVEMVGNLISCIFMNSNLFYVIQINKNINTLIRTEKSSLNPSRFIEK